MSVAYELEATVVALERAREHAIGARLGEHFVSEIEHLMATAQANKDEEERFMRELELADGNLCDTVAYHNAISRI